MGEAGGCSMTTMAPKTVYENPESLPSELGDALLSWALSLADSKHRIGIQLSHWVTGTPALEAAVSAAAITQDELGHARSLFSILRHFPDAPEGIGAENDLEARQIYYAPRALEPRWESWLQVVAINVVLDRALHLAIESFQGSAYGPLAGCAAKIMQEERFHRVFGDSWLARLGEDADTRVQLQEQINWAWAIADGWIGPDDDATVCALVEAGLLSQTVGGLRARWIAETAAVLDQAGFQQPASRTDWSTWAVEFRD